MNCKNCNSVATEKFCPNCGQKTSVQKLNIRSFMDELSTSVFQVDRGFFFTVIELFVRPGFAIRDYLEGKRKKYFKPIAYAVLLSTFYFLITKYFGSKTFIADVISGFSDGASDKGKEEFGDFSFFIDNYAYTILTLLPIYALASFIVFYKAGTNYLEHFILNSYLVGQQTFFYSLYAVISFALDDESDVLILFTLGMSMSYAFWVLWQLFAGQRGVGFVFRFILMYFLIFLIISILFIVSQAVLSLFPQS